MLISPQRLSEMREGLSHLHDDIAQYSKDHGPNPTPGSPAETAESTFLTAQPLIDARGHATHLLEVCGDQVTALVKTVTPPVEVMAPWACLRALLEVSAIASWLLDSSIEDRERAERSLMHHRTGQIERKKFAQATDDLEDVVRAEHAISSIDELAITAGIGRLKKRPDATSLVRDVLRHPWLYRLSSAVLHGHLWTLRLCYDEVEGEFPAVAGVPMGAITKSAKPDMMAYVLLNAASAFARPVWCQTLYLGWNAEELEGILERRFDEMGLSDRDRFWRST
jgi:hypothetical protein